MKRAARRTRSRIVIAVIGALALLLTGGATGWLRSSGGEAAAGDPDPGFGANGVVRLILPSGFWFNQITEMGDGHLALAGLRAEQRDRVVTTTVMLGRLQANGTLDPSFGQAGTNLLTVVDGSFPVAISQHADGSTFLASLSTTEALTAPRTLFLRRITREGALDSAFGGGQVAIPTFLTFGIGRLEADTLSDGRTLLHWTATEYVAIPPQFWQLEPSRRLVRSVMLTPNGSLDQSYGAGGIVDRPFFARRRGSNLAGYVLDPGFDVIAYGSIDYTSEDTDLALSRYRPDGSPDPSFGNNGEVVLDLDRGRDSATAAAIQSDGRLLVVAESLSIGSNRPSVRFLMRLFANGSLDRSFGDGGRVTITHPFQSFVTPTALQLVIGNNDEISLLDSTRLFGCARIETNVLVSRWDRDGQPVRSFGQDGTANIRLPTAGFEPWDGIVDRIGRSTLIGRRSTGPPNPLPDDVGTYLIRAIATGPVTPITAPFRLFVPTNQTCFPYRFPVSYPGPSTTPSFAGRKP